MYEEVKGDIEANTPDRFVSNRGTRPVSSVLLASAPPVETANKDDESESSDGGLGSMAANIAAMRTKLESKMKDVEALEKGFEARATAETKKVMILTEKEASTVVHDRAKEAGDLENNLDSYRSTISTVFGSEKSRDG